MNHHFRSCSEHQPVVSPQQQQQQQQQLGQSNNSIIKFHSDSQQSLDRLFNPIQTTVPLRDRQLPKSFFTPGYRAGNETGETNNNVIAANQSFHCRSMSYDQRPSNGRINHNNFHMRTTSTLAPMPALVSSNHSSSCQSSNEFSSLTNNTNATNNHSTNGWSSSGNSMEDLVATKCEISSPNGHHASANNIQQVPEQQPPIMGPNHQQQHHHHQNHQFTPAYQSMTLQQQPTPATMQHQTVTDQNSVQQAMQPAQAQIARPPAFYGSAQGAPQVGPAGPHNHVNTACPAHPTNNLHNRSISYDQRQGVRPTNQTNQFHMRTHSTVLAPMSGASSTNQSSHQSSHEYLNYTNQTVQSSSEWQSSGYSTDDLNATSPSHNWIPGQPQQVHAQPIQQHQQHHHQQPQHHHHNHMMQPHHHHHHHIDNHNHNHHQPHQTMMVVQQQHQPLVNHQAPQQVFHI